HEAHFTRVTEKFLEYLKNKNMPDWEVPNMLAKYYTTTKALELALKKP
ncbi:MAG: oxidoreductase, partial [Cyclobacteriaceae bacterium]|nr:oxidoreductase [Cyclobacteriaceae bacterium]